MAKQNSLDYMAIGAHADDVELMAGGTLLQLGNQGKQGVIVDVTDGSAGTRGTPEIRMGEAAAAAKVLGAQERINLGFPDSKLENSEELQSALIHAIRKYRPQILLTHHWIDEHPDHVVTAHAVKAAGYKAGLAKIPGPSLHFRPGRIFHFMGPVYFEPTLCVDISPFWDKKMEAVLCFKSQFHTADSDKFSGKTDIAEPAFLEYLEMRARFFGWRIKRKYAEPFFCNEIPEVSDLTSAGTYRF